MDDEFEVTYGVDDGYVGDRPHSFYISADEIDVDMVDGDITKLFLDRIQEDFEQCVSPYSEQESEFLDWAKEKREKMRQEE